MELCTQREKCLVHAVPFNHLSYWPPNRKLDLFRFVPFPHLLCLLKSGQKATVLGPVVHAQKRESMWLHIALFCCLVHSGDGLVHSFFLASAQVSDNMECFSLLLLGSLSGAILFLAPGGIAQLWFSFSKCEHWDQTKTDGLRFSISHLLSISQYC